MTLRKDLTDRQHASFFDAGDSKTAMRVNDVTVSTNILSVSGEKLTFSAGTGLISGVFAIDKAPIYDAYGTQLGSINSTSLSFSGTGVLDTEVRFRTDLEDAQQTALLTAGQYAVNYDTGRVRYRKNKHGGTTETISYISRQINVELTSGSTAITIGDVTSNHAYIATETTAGNIKTAVEIMDDWDESDRAKVNPIQGVAGVAGGAGITSGSTQRVTIATDDPVSLGTALPSSIYDGVKTVTTAGSSERLADTTTIKSVTIKALAANTGNIFVGGTSVSGSSPALGANDERTINISNLGSIYLDASVSGEGVGYYYLV